MDKLIDTDQPDEEGEHTDITLAQVQHICQRLNWVAFWEPE